MSKEFSNLYIQTRSEDCFHEKGIHYFQLQRRVALSSKVAFTFYPGFVEYLLPRHLNYHSIVFEERIYNLLFLIPGP